MNKFTPGPWLIGPYDPRLVFGNDGGLLAEACRGDSTQDIANARLIAAAPLMHEALANLIEFAKEDGWQNWTPLRQTLLREGIAALAAAGGSDGNR